MSERAIEKHVTSIFGKLGLAPAAEDHRRVLAVLAYLRAYPTLATLPPSRHRLVSGEAVPHGDGVFRLEKQTSHWEAYDACRS